MKQKYIKPTTKAYLIQARHNLLELSTQGVSNQSYSNGTILSREGRNSSWDDEEE